MYIGPVSNIMVDRDNESSNPAGGGNFILGGNAGGSGGNFTFGRGISRGIGRNITGARTFGVDPYNGNDDNIPASSGVGDDGGNFTLLKKNDVGQDNDKGEKKSKEGNDGEGSKSTEDDGNFRIDMEGGRLDDRDVTENGTKRNKEKKAEMPMREEDSDTSEEYSDVERDGGMSEEEEAATKVPLRSRRKSVKPPSIKINDDDMDETGQDNSPHNSITSINSIASLLKEKLAVSLPSMLKKKRPVEYKLKAFVSILFLCIVFLVGFAHVYYHQQVLQRAYFDNIRFNKEERVVRIYDEEQTELLHGHLGTLLHSSADKVYHCLPRDERSDGSVCMEWMHRARLYLNYKENKESRVRCYTITWKSLDENVYPTDCFEWTEDYGHWYGGGQTRNMEWPLELGKVEMSPFITGDVRHHQWGNVLNRYFINSKGVTISVDPNTPLYVSINAGDSKKFCLQAKYDDFAYVYHPIPLPQLNYSICTSDNISSLHAFLSEKNLWDGLKKEDLEIVNSLLTEPVWQIASSMTEELTESAVYNYTEEIIGLGFLRQGHVLLSEDWQTNVGDFTLDPSRFPTMEETINIIHRRGFRIIFTIQPYISTESVNFQGAVKDSLLIQERASQHKVPALIQFKRIGSAGVLDITNDRAIPWLQTKLKAIIDQYKIDSFYVDVGTAYDMPHYYQFDHELTNPDFHKQELTKAILQGVHALGKSVVGISSAISRPQAPIFVSLPPFPSNWESMRLIIPAVLTYGIAGFPFIMPGPVGGDFDINVDSHDLYSVLDSPSVRDKNHNLHLPDKELYVRWLQLATFLPVLRYTHLPSKYGDDNVLEIAKVLTALRLKMVNPLLKKYVREALDSGLPIIRPLWMLDPSDPACHTVKDEFSVGEELIVAPIISPGSTEREVYLPAGVWKDGIDSSLRKGSRWLHHYRVPQDKVAHFMKMPDNTRF